jgi:hypothetical protein
MLPKSSKHYIQPTAEKLGVDAQLVQDVIDFYYSKVRKNLSNLTLHSIRLDNLGTFNVKQKELPKLSKKYTKHLSVLNTDTFQQMQIRKDTEEKLTKVLRLQAILREERKRKDEQKILRNEYIRKNMGSTETDS